MAEGAEQGELTPEQAAQTMSSKPFLVLLVIVAVVGIVVSAASWCFLELVYQIQQEVFTHLPHALGYSSGPPVWWPLPVLAIAGVIAALAITRLPGEGGHLPANGLAAGGPVNVANLPGILLAALATIGLGIVLGPEAPLIAVGSGVAVLTIRAARRPTPPQALLIIGGSGAFAAVSFLFASPVIAAVLMIEVAGLGGPRLTLLLVPGLLAAGIGSLLSSGIGSFTGLSSSKFAIAPVTLPDFSHLTGGQFGWTILFAIAIAVVTRVIMVGGLGTHRLVARRQLLLLPIIGLIVAGLAIAFSKSTGKSVNEVLFSGQDALPGLTSQASSWSISALLLLIAFKGLAYSLSLGSFRGGPTFPAMFLGAAAGLLASHLPGFPLTPAVAVGMGAGIVSVLRLPLSAVVIAVLLTAHAGTADEPLVIVGVVVALVVTLLLTRLIPAPGSRSAGEAAADRPTADTGAPAPAPAG
jgi:H+/Cl- antiporter ClcA